MASSDGIDARWARRMKERRARSRRPGAGPAGLVPVEVVAVLSETPKALRVELANPATGECREAWLARP